MSTFTGGLGTSLASNTISSGLNWLSNKLGITMSQEEVMKKQWEYNQKAMALQNQYNQSKRSTGKETGCRSREN